MRRIGSTIALLVVVSLFWGCDSGGKEHDTGTDTGVDAMPDIASDPTAEQGECPGPPYGTLVGDTIADHEFVSYDGSSLSLCDIRDVPGNRLLLVYGTAGWCTQCTYESGDLPTIRADLHDDGLEVLAVVFEDESSSPADADYASEYRGYYGFTFPTVADPSFLIGAYFDKSSTPLNMFIDLSTMTILDIQTGYGIGGGPLRSDIEGYLGL